MILYTIGHSNHSIEKFLGLLQSCNIQRLVDVRSAPYSRFHPQFNKKNLATLMPEHGIEYSLAGDALGGRPADPTCYRVQSQMFPGGESQRTLDYAEVMQRQWFREGVESLVTQAVGRTTAILCSEEDPVRCHRHHLVALYMKGKHPEVEVLHIRGNGSIVNAESFWTNGNITGPRQLKLL